MTILSSCLEESQSTNEKQSCSEVIAYFSLFCGTHTPDFAQNCGLDHCISALLYFFMYFGCIWLHRIALGCIGLLFYCSLTTAISYLTHFQPFLHNLCILVHILGSISKSYFSSFPSSARMKYVWHDRIKIGLRSFTHLCRIDKSLKLKESQSKKNYQTGSICENNCILAGPIQGDKISDFRFMD